MFDVTGIGEILIDFSPAGVSEAGGRLYEQNAGGGPPNVLSAVASFGGKCAFIGRVGKDDQGDYLRSSLERLHIDCSNLTTDPFYNTTLAFVTLDDSGDRSFSFYRRHGADLQLSWESIDYRLIDTARILHFSTVSMTADPSASATRAAFKRAREKGVLLSFDPNYRPLLWESEKDALAAITEGVEAAHLVKMSREEAQMLTGEAEPEKSCRALLERGPLFAAVTLGPEGCVYASGARQGRLPSYPAKTIDTTGAGDIFWGTFLVELTKSGKAIGDLDGHELKTLLKLATVAAGISTEKKGGVTSIPSHDRVRAAALTWKP